MSKSPTVDDEADCRRWNVPDFGGPVILTGPTEETRNLAYEEGYERGRREGHESGREEVAAQAQRLEALMRALAEPFAELDREVEEGLVALTFAIVRQVVRTEIKTSPEQIATLVNETVSLLPGASRDVQLCLHPDDAQLLHDLQPGSDGENMWQIIGDAALQRGGCVVKTSVSRIDATVETRLDNIIASFLHVENSEEETS